MSSNSNNNESTNICPFMSTAALVPRQLTGAIQISKNEMQVDAIPVYSQCVKERCQLWDADEKQCGLATLFKGKQVQ